MPNDEGHEDRHKFAQHDAVDDDDRELMDPAEAWATAMTPEEYVLSSDEAMASAVEQQAILDGAT